MQYTSRESANRKFCGQLLAFSRASFYTTAVTHNLVPHTAEGDLPLIHLVKLPPTFLTVYIIMKVKLYLGTMELAFSHDHLSTAFNCHTICHAFKFTVVKCHTATLDDKNPLIIMSFLFKGDILDAYVTCTTFQCEFVIVSTRN